MISTFDIPKLQELLDNFYLITKIRIAVFDDGFCEIAASPDRHSAFCALIRSVPASRARCHASDHAGCSQCKKRGEPYTYRCHAGLTETVAPIRHKSTIIGYMMFGQVLPEDHGESLWGEIADRCAPYGIDPASLRSALERQPYVSGQKIAAAAQILEACAGYLWLSRLFTIPRDSLPELIEQFIGDHIGGELSVEVICSRFDISRSRLYKISHHCYGSGIQEHIRRLRIDLAKELLRTTALPVREVAERSGIPNYNYFTKVFRKSVGLTPRDYRTRFLAEGGGHPGP